jgi:predicted permease
LLKEASASFCLKGIWMFDAITAVLSLVFHAIVEGIFWCAEKVGASVLRLLPLSKQAKQDPSASKAFILGMLIILLTITIAWWFLVGLKH